MGAIDACDVHTGRSHLRDQIRVAGRLRRERDHDSRAACSGRWAQQRLGVGSEQLVTFAERHCCSAWRGLVVVQPGEYRQDLLDRCEDVRLGTTER